MKNSHRLIFVLSVVLVVSAMAGCKPKPEDPVAVKINERIITLNEYRSEFDRSRAIDPEFKGTPKDNDRLMEELITRELLIQEAMSMGLDLDEKFKRQIRKYYEQTLIEDLVRAKLEEFSADVSEEEIKKYYDIMGKVYHLDMAQFGALLGKEKCTRAGEGLWQTVTGQECRKCHEISVSDNMEVMLDYLPPEFSNVVTNLGPGEVSGPVLLGEKTYLIKLRQVRDVSHTSYAEAREQIRATLERRKKTEQMERWLRSLREKADVTVNRDIIEGGK